MIKGDFGPRMRCPICHGSRIPHRVRIGDSRIIGRSTMLSIEVRYKPEEQTLLHVHGQKTVLSTYSCSNGHAWIHIRRTPPCWCGWPFVADGPPEEEIKMIELNDKNGKTTRTFLARYTMVLESETDERPDAFSKEM